LSSSFSSCSFLTNILLFCLAFALLFLQIFTLCLYPFWKSISLFNSSYNTTFSFSPIPNLFFGVFTSKVKFRIFILTIATIKINYVVLSAFITFATTSSTNFGVLVYVVRSLDPSIDDPSSYTILLPSSNSNGNPFANFGLLGGTYNFVGLNFSKVGCVTTLFIYSSIAYRPSCVYCCYYYKCNYKC
jgi:hypothetical protein